MPATYTLIASNTLSSSAASVTFSAIPNTYTDLVLRVSIRDTAATTWRNFQWRYNNTTTTYSQTEIQGNGATASSTRRTGATYHSADNTIPANTATSNTFNNAEIYIPNYTVSQNKPISAISMGENNNATAYILGVAGLWSTTSAIDRLDFVADGTFASGSSFFLYGIKNS